MDVSAQESCTIIPTSPADLDPTGGVIVDGTQNVMIECSCGTGRVRWFYPNTTRILTQNKTPPGDPYLMNQRSALVIPTFSDSTSGVYTCGLENDYPPQSMVTINLTLSFGKCNC